MADTQPAELSFASMESMEDNSTSKSFQIDPYYDHSECESQLPDALLAPQLLEALPRV